MSLLSALPVSRFPAARPHRLPGLRRLPGGLLLLLLLIPVLSFSGDQGAEFTDIYQLIIDWLQGIPGRILMLISLVVAIFSGVVAQSLQGFAISLGLGIGIYYAPTLVQTIVSATVPLLP